MNTNVIAENWSMRFDLHPRDRIKGAIIEATAQLEFRIAQLQAEDDELQKTINSLHYLCKKGEQSGFEKAKEHFQSQLSAARKSEFSSLVGECVWKQEDDSMWLGSCGYSCEDFNVYWKFCPHCGKPIKKGKQ